MKKKLLTAIADSVKSIIASPASSGSSGGSKGGSACIINVLLKIKFVIELFIDLNLLFVEMEWIDLVGKVVREGNGCEHNLHCRNRVVVILFIL